MTDDTAPTIGRTLMVAIGVLFLFALVFFLVERPGCGPLSNTTRKVSGQVVDETGRPVPGVAVELQWNCSGVPAWE